jgi:hypothetical protein
MFGTNYLDHTYRKLECLPLPERGDDLLASHMTGVIHLNILRTVPLPL